MSGLAKGLATGRMNPAQIQIVVRSQSDEPDGKKKTSTVNSDRVLGPNLKLGLLINANQNVQSLRFSQGTGHPIDCREVTNDPGWAGVLAAFERYMSPIPDRKWVVFEIPDMASGFTSEVRLKHKPQGGGEQNIPIIAVHAQVNAPEHDVTAAIRRGEYGSGTSKVTWP